MTKCNIYLKDLILVNLFTALAMLFIFVPLPGDNIFKPILGIIFISFLPGYVFISFLFPRNTDISSPERFLLSFATSVAIVALVGFILNYTVYGIHLNAISYILVCFIIYFSVLTIIRRRIVTGNESYHFNIGTTFSGIINAIKREERLDKYLSLVLLIVIILSISMTTYAVVKPKPSDNFTEFYILGTNGKMSNYPTVLESRSKCEFNDQSCKSRKYSYIIPSCN